MTSEARNARRWRFLALMAAYSALAAILLAPLVAVRYPLLVDYLNHMARMVVIANADDPLYRTVYQVDWQVAPYLVMDALLPPLLGLLAWEDAGRGFVAAVLALLIGGVWAIRRQLFGRGGLWPVAAGAFVYNAAFASGMLSYVASVAAAFWAFAAWLAVRRHAVPVRLAVGGVGGLATALCHAFGAGLLGLLVTGWTFWRIRAEGMAPGRREWGLALASLLPAAAVLALSPPANVWAPKTVHGGWMTLLEAVASPLMFSPRPLHLWAALAIASLLAAVLALRILRLHPAMRPILALTLVLALVAPAQVAGVWGTHIRLPFVLVLLVLASAEFRPRERWLPVGAFVLLAALTLARQADIAAELKVCEADALAFRAAANDAIEPHARVLVAVGEGDAQAPGLCRSGRLHMTAVFPVIDKGAYVSLFYTTTRIVSIRPDFPAPKPLVTTLPAPSQLREALERPDGPWQGHPHLDRWWQRYDYVVWYHHGNRERLLPSRLSLAGHGRFFDIYRVDRAEGMVKNVAE